MEELENVRRELDNAMSALSVATNYAQDLESELTSANSAIDSAKAEIDNALSKIEEIVEYANERI